MSAGSPSRAAPSAWRLGRRLARGRLGRLAFLTLLIALGTGSLVAVSNLLASVDAQLVREARSRLGADVDVQSWQPFTPIEDAALEAALGERGVADSARVVRSLELASMVRGGRDAEATPFLVSLRAVDDDWPAVGAVEVDPPTALEPFRRGEGVLVARAVADRGLTLGTSVRIGSLDRQVLGIIVREPDAGLTGALGFAPRVLVPAGLPESAGLVGAGSRVRRRVQIALPDPIASGRPQALADALERRLDAPHVRVRTAEASQPQGRDLLERAAMFFALVALVTLVLAAVALAVSVLAFVGDDVPTVATLLAMGTPAGTIHRVYLGALVAVGVVGGAVGVALGLGLDALAIDALATRSGVRLPFGVAPAAVAEGLALAIVLAVGSGWAAVRRLVRVPAAEALRAADAGAGASLRLGRAERGGLVVLGLAAIAGWLVLAFGSVRVAGLFTGGLLAAGLGSLVTIAIGFAAVRAGELALSRLGGRASTRTMALRHALRQVGRERARVRAALFALGLGLALATALQLVGASLVDAIALDDRVPDVFLVDVQPDQADGVRAAAASHLDGAPRLAPQVRARLVALDGKRLDRADLTTDGVDSPEARRRARLLGREYNLTFRDETVPDGAPQRLVAGVPWAPGAGVDPDGTAEASLEVRFAGRLGVEVGTRMTFDVMGREVPVRVTSLRAIDWMALEPAFFVALPPGTLSGAPHTLIGAARSPSSEALAAFQRAVFEHAPNVSVVDVGPIVQEARDLVALLTAVFQALALMGVGVAVVLLGGSLHIGRDERLREASTLRALGMARRRLLATDALAWGVVGVVASATTLVLSGGLAAGITALMDVELATGASAAPAWGVALAAPLLLPLVAGLAAHAGRYRGAG